MNPTIDHLRLSAPHGVIPLGYVAEGSTVYLVARDRAALWPIEALRTGEVRLQINGAATAGRIRLCTDPRDKDEILSRFRAKYGETSFQRWYAHPARVLRVELGGTALPPTGPAYDDWIRDEFDNVAEDYDRHITGNRMNMLLRNRSLAQLRASFADARSLLDVGCGSGMETVPLLREGHELTAVDISERMLEVVRRKARAEGLTERLRTFRARAAELRKLVPVLGSGTFDGAYSTYGAMNCEPDLTPVADGFGALLRPNAPLVLGVYNRWCLFELLGYSFTGQTRRAFGRRHNPIPVGASRFCVDVYAYSPAEVEAAFRERFRREGLEGVPVLLPPSDLTAYAEKFARHFDTLASLDAVAGRRWGLRGLGDHFLMRLRRSATGTAG